MKLTVITGPTIPGGEALSDPVDCGDGLLVRITMPAAWSDDAPLTFQISSDGQGFNDLCDAQGFEIKVNVVPGAAVLVPLELSRALGFIKFRSGTRYGPVPQESKREFAVAIGGMAPTEPARRK